jgi:hypothetical protein
MKTDALCAGEPVFNFYSMEVVQRVGYDSFTPDNGVLLAKNKDREGNTCGYNCFTWVIDAHPGDINQVDFVRPNGTNVMRTVADYRQLNDALFHAGLRSGSQFEWEDAANRLHFYVIDIDRAAGTAGAGILSYTVGVRSLDGAGPQARDVALNGAPTQRVPGTDATWPVTLSNTGTAAETNPALHPQDAAAYLASDIYRLSVSIEGQGWSADLLNGLAAVRFGESQTVPVRITRAAKASQTAKVTLTAISESDPAARRVATATLSQ